MTETATLAEFLLARIAEDEERARVAASVDGADVMLAALPTALFDGLRVAFPARVLAECEAKRRIVELAQHAEKRTHDADPMPEGSEWLLGQRWGTGSALALLALPYADHSDYRQEWRP